MALIHQVQPSRPAAPIVAASHPSPNGGSDASQSSKQAPTASPAVYLSPQSAVYAAGVEFSVEARENSGQTAVNAVQIVVDYPADRLELVSTDGNSSAFTIQAQNIKGQGRLSLARGIAGSLKGDQLIAKLTFKAKSNNTSVHLTFQSGTQLLSSANNLNIIKTADSLVGADYTIN